MIVLYLMLMLAILVAIFLVGWFILAPVTEWAGKIVLALSIKGADYRALVNAQVSGEAQDPST